MRKNSKERSVDPIIENWILNAGNELWEQGETSVRDIVAESIDALREEDPEGAFIIEALFWERVSYRELMQRLGLTNPSSVVWRLNPALERLKEILLENEKVRKWLDQTKS